MTAKEKLMERAPHWTEEQAARALRAAESDDSIDQWGDLETLHEATTGETMRRLPTRNVPRDRSPGDTRRDSRTRDEEIDRLSEIFVVLATTNIRGLPTEVELGREDGMPRRCVLNADHTATIAKAYLREPITTLSAEKLSEVCRALTQATGC